MTTHPSQTLHNQLRLFEGANCELRTEAAICAESDAASPDISPKILPRVSPAMARASAAVGDSYDWVIREMPRSWRLEIQSYPGSESGFKSAQRAHTIQGALLRQLHGLSIGHFSILTLPNTLLKGPTSAFGTFVDRDLNSELAGETAIEKRLFNFALKETTRQYLDGVENWPQFDCPVKGSTPVDPWSENLWLADLQILTTAFEKWIQPLKNNQQNNRRIDSQKACCP